MGTKNTKTTDMVKKEQPLTGTGGKYNFPNAKLKLIEQSDKGRAVLAKAIENNVYFFNVGMTPVKSDEELCDRLNFFFHECAKTQQLPTVEKMANCLGYHHSTLNDWQNGRNHGFSPRTSAIIKKAKQILAGIDAELSGDGQIDRTVYIFRAKNYYGMSDQQEVVITPNTSLTDGDIKEIAQRYAELPDDDIEVLFEATEPTTSED